MNTLLGLQSVASPSVDSYAQAQAMAQLIWGPRPETKPGASQSSCAGVGGGANAPNWASRLLTNPAQFFSFPVLVAQLQPAN